MSTVSVARQRGLYAGITDQEIPQVRRDISRLREQISSGKRINRPSDGPDAYAVAEEMETLGNQFDRRMDAVETAQSFSDRTQQALDGMIDLFAQAKEKGVQAANDSVSDSDREAIAQELRSIKDEVVDQLNTRHDDEYVFAGNRTTTKPFKDDGTVNKVTHADIDGERTRPISRNQDLAVNITGKELHQYDGAASPPKTITDALDGLISAVDPNVSPDDVQAELEEITAARDHVISKGSKAGTIGNRLSTAQEQLEAAKLNAQERQSNAEDTDLAKAASDLQQKQTQLQAALKAVASTKQQTSLVNLLR